MLDHRYSTTPGVLRSVSTAAMLISASDPTPSIRVPRDGPPGRLGARLASRGMEAASLVAMPAG